VQAFVPPRYRRQPSGPMAELSAKDKQLLGEAGQGSSASSEHHGRTTGRR
jgi:UDP-GlcNAc:undecaprenyl-phosphate GlcNAc-1-phosphate transferase